jgi:hypothetical protein
MWHVLLGGKYLIAIELLARGRDQRRDGRSERGKCSHLRRFRDMPEGTDCPLPNAATSALIECVRIRKRRCSKKTRILGCKAHSPGLWGPGSRHLPAFLMGLCSLFCLLLSHCMSGSSTSGLRTTIPVGRSFSLPSELPATRRVSQTSSPRGLSFHIRFKHDVDDCSRIPKDLPLFNFEV